MPSKYTRGSVREIATLAVPPGWSTPAPLDRLGTSGRLSYFTIRGPVSSAITQADVMVWVGGATDDVDVSSPDTEITEANRVFYRTAIVITGDAVTADDSYNISSGAGYQAQSPGDRVWYAVKGTGTTSDDFELSFEAEEVS